MYYGFDKWSDKIMKRVGIVTWYFGANYGALAQSIALCKVVSTLGYECAVVNYRPRGYVKTIVSANIPPKWHRLLHLRKTVDGIRKCACLSKNFFLTETSRVRNAQQIDGLKLDCLIFGSDAIFNIKHRLCKQIYFGVGIKTPKITYSPSCEYLNPVTDLPEDYRQSLKEMGAMSVRDISTFQLVEKNTGLKPQITLDPTFLYKFNEIPSIFETDRYLLIYSFSDWSVYKDRIREYAKENNLSIIVVGQSLTWADYSYPNASFEQWVDSFRKALLVVTDSFHGTVFSMKYNKPIVLCGRHDKKSKIQALLSQLGVPVELYQGEKISDYLCQNTIDYEITNKRIEDEVIRSISYLRESLDRVTGGEDK